MINRILKEHKLTQGSLASLVDVRPSTFSEYKKKKRPLCARVALELAYKFHLPICLQSDLSHPVPDRFFNHLFFPFPEKRFFWKNMDMVFSDSLNSLKQFFIDNELPLNRLISQRGKNDAPQFDDLLKIADLLNVSPFLLFSSELDIDVLKNNMTKAYGRPSNIPLAFTQNGGSKMRTFKHATNYAAHHFGHFEIGQILKSLQISRSALSHSDKNISIALFAHFHQSLKKLGADEYFFIKMGAANTHNKKNQNYFRQKIEPQNQRDVYEGVLNVFVGSIDQNFYYEKIELNNHECIIKTIPRPERLSLMGESKGALLSKEVMLYRFGHFVYAPNYFGFATPSLKNCDYRWDEKSGEAIFFIRF